MELTRIDHVSLNVHDRPRTIAWYEQVLGVRAHDHRAPADEPVFLGTPGVRLGLFADRAPGLRHVAFATDPASQHGLVARLRGLAIPYVLEDHRDSRSVYFADPDGATLEVMVPTS